MSGTQPSSPAASPPASPKTEKAEKKPGKKQSYMLHTPDECLEPIGKFVSTSIRGAALKAVTRGHTDIWLRRTGQKKIVKFKGEKKPLDAPRVVMKGDKEIVFKTKSAAERVGELFMTDTRKAAKMDAAEVDENPVEE